MVFKPGNNLRTNHRVFNNRRNDSAAVIIYLSMPQRAMLKRILEGENVSLGETIRAFSMKQVRRYSEAGLWIVVKPEKNSKIITEDRKILAEA